MQSICDILRNRELEEENETPFVYGNMIDDVHFPVFYSTNPTLGVECEWRQRMGNEPQMLVGSQCVAIQKQRRIIRF